MNELHRHWASSSPTSTTRDAWLLFLIGRESSDTSWWKLGRFCRFRSPAGGDSELKCGNSEVPQLRKEKRSKQLRRWVAYWRMLCHFYGAEQVTEWRWEWGLWLGQRVVEKKLKHVWPFVAYAAIIQLNGHLMTWMDEEFAECFVFSSPPLCRGETREENFQRD